MCVLPLYGITARSDGHPQELIIIIEKKDHILAYPEVLADFLALFPLKLDVLYCILVIYCFCCCC